MEEEIKGLTEGPFQLLTESVQKLSKIALHNSVFIDGDKRETKQSKQTLPKTKEPSGYKNNYFVN